MQDVKKYRKKPAVIDAVLLTVDNIEDAAKWCNGTLYLPNRLDSVAIDINTLEGSMRAKLGDYVIKGVAGEFYPCKASIFAKTYEAAK